MAGCSFVRADRMVSQGEAAVVLDGPGALERESFPGGLTD